MAKKTTTTNQAKKISKKDSTTSETMKTLEKELNSMADSMMTSGNDDKTRYVLKVAGKAESPKPLTVGHNIHVSLEGSIVSETRSDNEDGSFTHTYAFKPIRVAMLTEKGESIKMKDTRSNSQLLRSLIYKRYMNAASPMTFEDFYTAVMASAMVNIDKIIDSANVS